MGPFSAFVEAKEPGTLRYEICRQVNGDAEVLVYLQVYVQCLISLSGSFLVNFSTSVDDPLTAFSPYLRRRESLSLKVQFQRRSGQGGPLGL